MPSASILEELSRSLATLGLRLRGGFALVQDLDSALLAAMPEARSLLLIGNVGSEMWRRSAAAIEARGGAHALDDWTRDVVTPLADAYCGKSLFPFEGPPYWPFQRWAMRAEGVASSPLGILIHPDFGLWHAYRAAILLPVALDLPPPEPRAHPCDSCAGKPCLDTCPVGAFSAAGYEVDHCARHVYATRSDPEACHSVGCLARRACPVGAEWRYGRDHAAFHMRAFLRPRLSVLQES